MGNHAQKLAERILTKGPKHGYCAICREHGKLTREHVPPAGCGNVSNVVLKSLSKIGSKDKRHSVVSQGGLTFGSTCHKCNNDRLGTSYDPELIKLYREMKDLSNSIQSNQLVLPRYKTFFVKPQKIARSVIGHIIAANSISTLLEPTAHSGIYSDLVEYFKDGDVPLPDNVEIYYWFYPSRDIKVLKSFGRSFKWGVNPVVGDVLKFFPLAFWVVWNVPEEINISLPKLLPNKKVGGDELTQITVDFVSHPQLDFPEIPDDNGASLYASQINSVGIPKFV
ncbi:hypothetical protein KW465_01980 [Vibrio fluvialis]|nr:hypothetical protein [Vibrio fluvialis]MBY8058373.1 hypothetical protein [Vibrio fluvialis]MBY8192645.1 hypothetical protein [Vibrio fluvialis]